MSYILVPPFLDASGAFTPAGEELDKYIRSQVRARLDELKDPDVKSFETLRRYYAAVMRNPPKLTAEQFFAAYEREVEDQWSMYLSTLDPIASQRAQIRNPQTQESTMSENKSHTVLLNESVQEHRPMNTKLTYREQTELADYLRSRARSERGLPLTDATAVWTSMVEARNMRPDHFFQSFDAIGRQLYSLMMDDVVEQLESAKAALNDAD